MPVLAGIDEMPGEIHDTDPRGISFSELRSSDLDLMHRWLNAPHVREWWYDEGTTRQEIEDHYLPRIEGRETARPFVILHNRVPVGYIQTYPISDEDDAEYAALVDVANAAGVDLFIGEPEYLYRGLGQHIIRAFLFEHVFSEPDTRVCVIGPEPKNSAAIRTYEKAGFKFFKTIQVPGEPEPEYLMKLSREEFEGSS